MFSIGQKVVCIDNSAAPDKRWPVGEKLVIGGVYTIDGFFTDPEGHECCYIAEITRRERWPDGTLYGYWVRRFRPATDISIFTAMLEPKKKKAKV